MEDIGNENSEKKGRYLGMFIVFVFAIFVAYRSCKLDNEGVITICKVDHYEPAGSGSSLYIKIYYQGKEYNSIANSMCGECDGKFFFIRIIKGQPLKEVVFLKDYPVPDCISKKTLPYDGWVKIPSCTEANE
ncbi:hypothetical protein [Ferruginibacter profundus]